MDTLTLVLLIANVLLAAGLVALLLRRPGNGATVDVSRDLAANRDELARLITANQIQLDQRFETLRNSLEGSAKNQREEATESRVELQKSMNESIGKLADQIRDLTEANSRKQIEMQNTMQVSLEKMQKSNEEKLEKMRETVDEKLQGTLEKRLGESFKLVSDRLESVQKGLGEMQSLATGVGDLKRVLTNVKSRGTWGEVQLSRQLEDMLAPSQYESNVKTKAGSNDLVEFAVKMPGRDEGEHIYLPIDSKFPQEDYERLLQAQESGDLEALDKATKAIEMAIKAQAKTISEKYIDVPHTTDFAIMYLPTEGLFAEVIRRPGLTNELQNKFRVQVTGPSTLSSFLNSLQMGFRTLAIEKSASDVWKILSAAKTEFHKYGQVWDKLQRQLETAQKTVADAKTRTNVIERKLKSVETLEVGANSTEFLALESEIQDAEVIVDADIEPEDRDDE
ncbi:MAG: DNA recombination protein RmuC [Actinomycetales bacterium]|nr:DNA recombination protein RmuC [Actinomycetales bacterium]